MKQVFHPTDSAEFISRINKLTIDTKPKWGKMSVDQMLAHCNVAYDMALTDKYQKATGLKKLLLTLFIKDSIVSEKPYKHSIRTAPEFLITDARVFETEKQKLIDHINKTLQLGEAHFDGKESLSFGALNKTEWNNLFSKHLDHHLTQFGV